MNVKYMPGKHDPADYLSRFMLTHQIPEQHSTLSDETMQNIFYDLLPLIVFQNIFQFKHLLMKPDMTRTQTHLKTAYKITIGEVQK